MCPKICPSLLPVKSVWIVEVNIYDFSYFHIYALSAFVKKVDLNLKPKDQASESEGEKYDVGKIIKVKTNVYLAMFNACDYRILD